MPNLDKSLQSLINLQKSVDRLTLDPFVPLIKQQERMLSAYTLPNQLAESARLANQLLSKPFQKIARLWNDSALLAFQSPLTSDAFQQQINSIQNSLAAFSSAFESIAIHDNYVNMPEALIPDDFNYTEVDRDVVYGSEEILPGSISVKKLSISDAISVVCNLIMLLFTIITFIQTQQSSIQQQQNHEEVVRLEQRQISLREDSNSMQQKENELRQIEIDSIEQNTEYLIGILSQLQEIDEDSPVTLSPSESALPGTDSCSQCGHLQSVTAELTSPTKADDSDHIAAEPDKTEPH